MTQQQGLPQRAPAAPKKELSRKARLGCLTAALAVIAAVVLTIVVMSGGPSASYRARVVSYAVVDPADLAVTIRVTNTGKAAGTPDCTVMAQDPSGADSGVNEGTLASPVRPGQTVTTVMNLTITHQSARFVDQATVTCR